MRQFALFIVLTLFTLSPAYAQRPDAPQYALRGEYVVGVREVTIPDDDRPLDLTIWYPATNPDNQPVEITYTLGLLNVPGEALRDAVPDTSAAPYPLVVFSHGSSGTRYQSIFMTEHLASHGFVVIGVEHPGDNLGEVLAGGDEDLAPLYIQRPQDVVRIIDYAESVNSGEIEALSPLADLIDAETVITIGHSFGGYTALAAGGIPINFDQLERVCEVIADTEQDNICFLLEAEDRIAQLAGLETPTDGPWPPISDPRIQATVALSPWNSPILDFASRQQHDVPTMIIVGGSDSVTPPERDAYPIYDSLDSAIPKALVTLENGGHYLFIDECPPIAINLGLYESCSDQVWDMQRAHDLTNHFTLAFLQATLYEDEAAITALQPETVDFRGLAYRAALQPVEELMPEVLSVRDHDTGAFTQGLLLHEGFFYESAGQYGESNLRRVDPETGEVLQQVNLSDQFFAEGLALVDDRLYQITWRENTAIVYDLETFETLETFFYVGEGWGLCYDGEALYMTDGSDTLFIRDTETFEIIEEIPVTFRGEPLTNLNELECVGDDIYANVWQTDSIVRIDKASGVVEARINAAGLLTQEEAQQANVLNGIAYDAENEVFYITGKYWPKLFEVNFVPVEESGE